MPDNITLEPLPFEEAIAFFADKIDLLPEEFYALADEVRAKAFTVSRVASMDVIMDVHNAVGKAIESGETLADFKGRLGDIMEARGWQGLTPWHAETVFRNNVQTAYSAGRYKQMIDQVENFPFWEYDAVNDSATRPTHAALDGKIFPANHSFWDTWYPPNGHRCRCGVNPVHRSVVEEEGLKVETEDPTNTLIEPIDPKTGKRMPARYLMPDHGWDHNPAKVAWQPDISKYPAVLRNAMERGGAGMNPLSVENFDDAEKLVAEKLTPLTKLPTGQKLELLRSRFGNFMSTNSNGRITVSTFTFIESSGFNPADDLVNALKNLGGELTFNQEYALESLWHEIMHNRQKFVTRFNIPDQKSLMMETLNQWVSRRTYDKMLTALGDFTPQWRDTIKYQGYGYTSFVRRFDRLISRLGLQDEDLVEELYHIHSEIDRYEYAQPVAEYLAQTAGRPGDSEKIRDALDSLRNPDVFEEILGEI